MSRLFNYIHHLLLLVSFVTLSVILRDGSCVRLPGCQKSCALSSPPPFFFLPRVFFFSHGPCVCRVWVTHWHRGGSNNNNNSGRDNNSCYAFSRFRQFMDETLTIIKPWSRRAELKLLLLLLLLLRVVRWGLAEVFVGRRRVQTDVISRDCVFTKWGRKARIYD